MGANLESLLGAPRDPQGPVAYDQRADQGVLGAPVPAPSPYAQGVGQLLQGAPDASQAAPGGKPIGLTAMNGPGANAAPADPTQGMSALEAARYRYANNLPMTGADAAVLDAAQGFGGAGGGGGPVSSTTVTRMKQNDSDELRRLREERKGLEENQTGTLNTLADAEGKAALERSQMIAQNAQQLTADAAEMQNRQEIQAAKLERMNADYQKAGQDYVKQAQSIDPNRIMTGGKRVTAAIAMALGAAGAVMGRTQNFAKDIIDGELARDLDAQKMALAGKRENLTLMQQAFQHAREIYGDDAAARAAVKSTAYRAQAALLDANAAKLQGTEKKAAALQQRDQLLMAANERDMEAAQIAAGRMQVSTTTQSGGAGKPVDMLERLAKQEALVKAHNENAGKNGPGPDEKDKAAYAVASEKAAPWLSTLRQVDRVRDLVGKTGALGRATGRGSQEARDLSSYQTALKNQFLQAITGAAFSPAQAEDAKKLIEGSMFDTSEQAQHRLDALKNFTLSQIQGHVGTLHPELQRQYRNRLAAGGVPANLINDIGVGQTSNKNDEADALGAR